MKYSWCDTFVMVDDGSDELDADYNIDNYKYNKRTGECVRIDQDFIIPEKPKRKYTKKIKNANNK